ncbi:MAG: FGGY family carbohydrate kinase [Eubacteriales bacterium]|nr:FGGY family carbohydrate kinase [Eubacteriales bacterium]
MNLMGLDLGSTSLSCVALDAATGRVLRALTRPVKSALPPDVPGGVLMDPDGIVREAQALLRDTAEGLTIDAIGLTGQMHGILYLGADGRAVSPLYTWQDQRGLLAAPGGEAYSERLTRLSRRPMAAGYGLTTHYVLSCQRAVPENAVSLCTIADYLAMRLCALSAPCLHESMAHSLGLWDMDAHRFDEAALRRAGLNAALLPMTVAEICRVGRTDGGVPVAVAIGDNQAGYLGAVAQPDRSVLLNIGTSGQVSVKADALPEDCGMELRPLDGGARLAVGATLCGGKAYQQVADFLADCARLCGASVPADLYERMNQAALAYAGPVMTVRPTFAGARRQPDLLGEITGISRSNMTCASLIRGTIDGMLRELYTLYAPLRALTAPAETLIGSGNAIRHNPALRAAAETLFGLPLQMPRHREEAAYGAALTGGVSCGVFASMAQARRLIHYEGQEPPSSDPCESII